MPLDYHAIVRRRLAGSVLWGVLLLCAPGAPAQEEPPNKGGDATYQDTFAGQVVELSTAKVTVSRTALGGKTEKRTFVIKPDTRIEGKLKTKAKVTIGFISSEDGDVARLIVVRTNGGGSKKQP
jgi:hypothetical protein